MFELTSEFFSTVEEVKSKFYVFFDIDSGQIRDIIKQPSVDKLKEPYIDVPVDHELVTAVMLNKLAVTQLIVAFDKDTGLRNLFKKDNYLRRIQYENSALYKVNQVDEAVLGTQVSLFIYTKDNLAELTVHKESLDGFLSIVNTNNLMYDGYDNMEFYIVNATNPLKLYATIRIPTEELIIKERVLFNVTIPTTDIVIYTKRIFSSYQTQILDHRVETAHMVNNQSAQYYSYDMGNYHIGLNITDDGVRVHSNIVDPYKFSIFDHVDLHVVKKSDPSYYIKTIRLSLDDIKNKNVFDIDQHLDVSHTLLHDNPYIRVTLQ